MRCLNNLKVGSKIILLATVLIVFLIGVASLGAGNLNRLNNECNALYEQDLVGLSNAKDASANVGYASRALRNYILTGIINNTDELATNKKAASFQIHKDSYTSRMAAALKSTEATATLFTDQGSIVKAKSALATLKDTKAKQEEIFTLVDSNQNQDKILLALSVAMELEKKSETALDEIANLMEKEGELRFHLTDDVFYGGLAWSALLLALALLLSVALVVMIRRAIASPLESVAGKAELVAGGDLNQHFNLVRSDEIGSLASALERMVENLRERIADAEQKSHEAAEQSRIANAAVEESNIAKQNAEEGQKFILSAAENVEQVVSRLYAATEEISAQIEESSHSAEIQRERVTNSATAMEEMNSTVLEVARNAAVASEGSERARLKAKQGENIVRDSINALSTVQKDTNALREIMQDLGHQSEAIGAIMVVISDIADQTNLLALNAAIEAARAGDAGRGFAVVADEVRKLAEKTMGATKEVGNAINGIQQGTRRSIEAMDRTKENLEGASNLVEKSGQSLAEIVTESVLTADQVRNIATAAEQQSASSEEISHSFEEIHRLAGENSMVMQQSADAVTELARQSHQLQKLVSELRTGK